MTLARTSPMRIGRAKSTQPEADARTRAAFEAEALASVDSLYRTALRLTRVPELARCEDIPWRNCPKRLGSAFAGARNVTVRSPAVQVSARTRGRLE